MKNSLFIYLFCMIGATSFAQDKTYRIQAGTTHFMPNYVRNNVRLPYKSLPSFQASIAKDYPLTKFLDVTMGLGLNRNDFEAEEIGQGQKIWLTYLSLEPGFVFKKEVREVAFFVQVGAHLSRLIGDNYSQFFLFQKLSSADYGANLSLGARWESKPLRPYLKANYRRSLVPVSSTAFSYTAGSNDPVIVSHSFSNQSIGFLVGIYVW